MPLLLVIATGCDVSRAASDAGPSVREETQEAREATPTGPFESGGRITTLRTPESSAFYSIWEIQSVRWMLIPVSYNDLT